MGQKRIIISIVMIGLIINMGISKPINVKDTEMQSNNDFFIDPTIRIERKMIPVFEKYLAFIDDKSTRDFVLKMIDSIEEKDFLDCDKIKTIINVNNFSLSGGLFIGRISAKGYTPHNGICPILVFPGFIMTFFINSYSGIIFGGYWKFERSNSYNLNPYYQINNKIEIYKEHIGLVLGGLGTTHGSTLHSYDTWTISGFFPIILISEV